MTITNSAGTIIDFEAAHALMDADICEEIHGRAGTETEQGFFKAYCLEHLRRFGNIFEVDRENPCM